MGAVDPGARGVRASVASPRVANSTAVLMACRITSRNERLRRVLVVGNMCSEHYVGGRTERALLQAILQRPARCRLGSAGRI
jgi:hypothetical protein